MTTRIEEEHDGESEALAVIAETAALARSIATAHRTSTDAGDTPFDSALWEQLAAAGLTDSGLLVSATAGPPPGVGVIAALAAAGADVPIVEHLWLGLWAAEAAGLSDAAEAAVAIVVQASEDGGLTAREDAGDLVLDGSVQRIAWADAADEFVVVCEGGLTARVPRRQVQVHPPATIMRIPVADLVFDSARVPAGRWSGSGPALSDLDARRTLGRLLQIRAAALEIVELSIAFVRQRVQFGRQLARFQAVQTHVAGIVSEAAMLSAGVDLGLRGSRHDIDLARVDARRSVTVIHRSAHQLHGAMGVTHEYPLGGLSSAMLGWLADSGPDPVFVSRARARIKAAGAWASVAAPTEGLARESQAGEETR